VQVRCERPLSANSTVRWRGPGMALKGRIWPFAVVPWTSAMC